VTKQGSTSILQLFRERRTRDAIYHVSRYWDRRAEERTGLARSMWPSNTFNALWDERQRELLLRTLGDLRSHAIADIGCGTGRMSRFFIDRGAREVVGVDFSETTLAMARDETVERGVSFVQGDVVAGLDHVGVGRFDDVVVLGCFSVACRDAAGLDRAFVNVARLAKPGGRVLVLEPIHRSPLLRRVLDLGVEEWIASANRAGLVLERADRMGVAPVRFFLSVRDLPSAFVGPVFRVAERLLDRAPYLAPISDYKLLLFRAR
jgi:SAM-dependent methyltransferase